MMGERMRRGDDERVGILRRLLCRFGGGCEGIYPLGLMGTGFVTPCRRCGRVRYVMGPDEVDVQPKPLAEKVKPRLGEPERLARVARLMSRSRSTLGFQSPTDQPPGGTSG